MTVNNKNHRKN